MRLIRNIGSAALGWTLLVAVVIAQSSGAPTNSVPPISSSETNTWLKQTNTYVIVPNDVIHLKVYQEDDLETKAKVDREGFVTVPLVGVVRLGGKSVDEASRLIHDQLDKRFVVNPQVALTVVEYSRRRFTILGQVQRTGVYEFTGDEKLSLLQAIAIAGGFTRLAAPSKVTIYRTERGQATTYKVNAERASKDPESARFQILPDDTISVGTRLF